MNTRSKVSRAIATVLALGAVAAAQAQDASKEKERCFGVVAQPGTNDCANLSGTHSCAGQSKSAKSLEDFNYVARGTCAKLGGKSEEEAKAELAKK